MGLSDTLVHPISQSATANNNNNNNNNNDANCSPPLPTQTPSNGCFSSNNYQPNANPPQFYPNYGYPPAYASHGHLANGMYNTGGGVNGSGIQKNGGSKVGNWSQRTGGVNIDSIGSNIGNQCGKQVVGDVAVGNIG